MPSPHETAHPRLKADLTPLELEEIYTPTSEEQDFVYRIYRQSSHRAYVLIQLKVLQRLGYFVQLASLPVRLIGHILLWLQPWL
jgi:hypothetical protein